MTLRLSEQQLQDFMNRRAALPWMPPPIAKKPESKRRGPNKLEDAYGWRLEMLRLQGEVLRYYFERVTLKIAEDCRYTPDYFVVTPNGLQLHEVKGPHAWEDSIIKLKVAADMFPCFRFSLHKRVKGEWVSKEIRPA